MGNREDLLVAAKRLLYEKGYARITARDLTAASGVSLAAIGYHFGSKEALLNAARIEALGEWADELGRTLAAGSNSEGTPLERFEAIWAKVLDSFATHRPLWAASFELLAQVDQSPAEVRAAVADAQERARLGLAGLFHHLDPTVDQRSAWVVGSFYLALLPGVVAQWLIDPEHAPSARDLAQALQRILVEVSSGQEIPTEPAATP